MKQSSFKRGLNIFVIHAHWNNRGDEALLRAMFESLKLTLPINRIRIMLLSKDVSRLPYSDLSPLVFDPSIRNNFRKILFFVLDLIISLITSGKLAFTNQTKDFIAAVQESDIVVHSPGGWIGDYKNKSRLSDLPYLYRLLLVELNRKPFFFYSVSIGPFSGWLMNKLRASIFKRATAMLVRDKFSRKYLKEQLGVDSDLVADLALRPDLIKTEPGLNSNNVLTGFASSQRTIGVAVSDLKWHPKYCRNRILQSRIKNTFFCIIRYLVNKGYSVVLIPVTFGLDNEELKLYDYFREIDKDRVAIVSPEIDCIGQQQLISKFCCIISMRFHTCVFAANANVPFVAISYSHKTEDLMNRLHLSSLSLMVEDIATEEILEKLRIIEDNYTDLKRNLSQKTEELRQMSIKGSLIIKQRLRNLGIIEEEPIIFEFMVKKPIAFVDFEVPT